MSRKRSVKTNKAMNDKSYLRPPTNTILFQDLNNDNDVKSESTKKILMLIDKAHNLLYNEENITGDNALNDIMNLLFIRLLQPLLSDKEKEGKIDLLNKSHYEKCFDEDDLDDIFNCFKDLNYLISKPTKEIRDNKHTTDKIRQMGEILSVHPVTAQIFTEINFLKMKKTSTIKRLIDEIILKVSITELSNNEDVIGEIYEHIINGYVKKGSKLGQFFTPRKMMKLLLHYKQERITELITDISETGEEQINIYDSCMGTAGWLVLSYNMLWEYYSQQLTLSGGEIDSNTFKYGLMNLILTLQQFPDEVKCESSLTHVNDTKYHFIFTNPPFQTGKKFDSVKENFENDTYTINNGIKLDDVYYLQNNGAVIQFLELNYYKLKENGLCIIIVPYGEIFNGDRNKKSRDYFMSQFNITDIIILPGGTFSHTAVKTACIIFENNGSTSEIIMSEMSKDCSTITEITRVTIEDINKHPNHSWYSKDYVVEPRKEIDNSVYWVPFGDVFTLEKGKIQSTEAIEDENGDGVFINCSIYDKYKKISNGSLFGENLFISTSLAKGGEFGGYMVIKYYDGKCDYSNLMSRCVLTDEYKDYVNLKYMYYYLKSIQDVIERDYQKGSSHKSLDRENFFQMEIPIPTLERQIEIALDIDKVMKNKELSSLLIEQNEDLNRTLIKKYVKDCKEFKTIGEVCEINYGTRITKQNNTKGIYPVYGGGDITFTTNTYNRDNFTIIISRFGVSKTCVRLINEKIFLNDSGMSVVSTNDEIITNEYFGYYLYSIQDDIYNCALGTAQANLKLELFNALKIPILSIEKQKELVDRCNEIDEISKLLNKQNENFSSNEFLKSFFEF